MKDKDIPQSDKSYAGGTNGSLGDASKADLKRGYTKPSPAEHDEFPDYDSQQGGFCGRPKGWER